MYRMDNISFSCKIAKKVSINNFIKSVYLNSCQFLMLLTSFYITYQAMFFIKELVKISELVKKKELV